MFLLPSITQQAMAGLLVPRTGILMVQQLAILQLRVTTQAGILPPIAILMVQQPATPIHTAITVGTILLPIAITMVLTRERQTPTVIIMEVTLQPIVIVRDRTPVVQIHTTITLEEQQPLSETLMVKLLELLKLQNPIQEDIQQHIVIHSAVT